MRHRVLIICVHNYPECIQNYFRKHAFRSEDSSNDFSCSVDRTQRENKAFTYPFSSISTFAKAVSRLLYYLGATFTQSINPNIFSLKNP